jgi:hypothetical protein
MVEVYEIYFLIFPFYFPVVLLFSLYPNLSLQDGKKHRWTLVWDNLRA